ncbi:4'-phosphopantetheinyl transferase [Streptomyces sp. NPDC056161]|uniref:4'-phosphopantetheinyl transferase family protein n=1 Tax=Streptomyces sp. NPDC056161 TaxID=3345732 RepID=UPI0035DA46DE
MNHGSLLGISDLHVAYAENRKFVESLRPASDQDWLIVVGGVGERSEDIAWALSTLGAKFARVIWCVHQALDAFDAPTEPILRDRHGAPQWPDSVLGSITHCFGYRAAALARTSDMTMVGIDAEPNAPLPEGVLRTIALPSELQRVRKLRDTEPNVHWDRFLFSTREAMCKCWYPFAGQRLKFDDAQIHLDAHSSVFTAYLRPPSHPSYGQSLRHDRCDGRRLVHTAC